MLVTQDIKAGDEIKFASVYFIRPKPLKPKGVADKPVTVEYQDKVILTAEEGGYTLLRIKPSEGFIKVFCYSCNMRKLHWSQECLSILSLGMYH